MNKHRRRLYRHIRRCLAALGSGDVAVCLHWQQAIGGDPDTAGECTSTPRYNRACIRLRNDLRANRTGYEIAAHEAAHVAGRQRAQAVDRILELVPGDQRDHALALWRDGNEADTTALARGLSPLLQKGRK